MSRPPAFNAQAFLDSDASGEAARRLRCGIHRKRGDFLFNEGGCKEAQAEYVNALKSLIDASEVPALPSSGVTNEFYIKMSPWEGIDAVGCCVSVARCFKERKKYVEALEWLSELDIICKNICGDTTKFDWHALHLNSQEYYAHCMQALSVSSEIFALLQNTSMATHSYSIGFMDIESAPSNLDKTALRHSITANRWKELVQLRHPDPQLSPRLTVQDADLQIRGSWSKLKLQSPGGMTPRLGSASFIWRSHLYVYGGERGKTYMSIPSNDLWKLKLSTLDAWQQLQSCPAAYQQHLIPKDLSMVVHEDKAYLFTGSPRLYFFDLQTEQWASTETAYKNKNGRTLSWPYPDDTLEAYTAYILRGILYVFGGTHSGQPLGCNLFLALNISQRTWRRLSGTAHIYADHTCPGPRSSACGWTDAHALRLYVMYGDANRAVGEHAHRAKGAHMYGDIWSWGVQESAWRRERVHGNPPSPRSEMACVVNERLKQVVVFGGYSTFVHTYLKDRDILLEYSYFADCFILDTSVSPSIWKQCMTRGFPTYRAKASLVSDPDTGKTYLFGGYTTPHFLVQNRVEISRSFADLWQLRTDTAGGCFDGVDVDEEARTARAGPWQRCYTCGCAGMWRKCGGSCGGNAFFCDAVCQKEGWKDHKKQHACSKI